MSRQCQRPDCADPASVGFRFDMAGRVVVLDHLKPDDREGGALCFRHASTMVLPKGWWLDDRRQAVPTLFANLKRDLEAAQAPARRRRPTTATPRQGRRSVVTPSPAAARVSPETEIPAQVPGASSPEPARRPPEPSPVAPITAAPVAVAEPSPASPVVVHTPLWSPDFDADDDLGGLLNADSPLLSRAFSGRRTKRPSKKAGPVDTGEPTGSGSEQ